MIVYRPKSFNLKGTIRGEAGTAVQIIDDLDDWKGEFAKKYLARSERSQNIDKEYPKK